MRSAGLLCVCALLAPLGAASEFAGTWKRVAVAGSEAPDVVTIRDVRGGIAYRSSTGVAYTARFDGDAAVTLVRLDPHTLRMVVRRNGAVARTTTLSIAHGELTEATEVSAPGGRVARSVGVYRKGER